MAKRHGEVFKDNFFSSMIAKPADNKRTATLEPFPNRSRSVYSLKDNKSGLPSIQQTYLSLSIRFLWSKLSPTSCRRITVPIAAFLVAKIEDWQGLLCLP